MSLPETPAGTRTGIFDQDREKWLLARAQGIGASEAAALLGRSKFSSALEVYASKVQPPPVVESELMDWGHILEAPIIGEYAKRQGIEHQMEGEMIFSARFPHAFCTIDASTIGENGPEAIECKTTSMGHLFPQHQGDEKELPIHIQIQLQQQLLCTGWKKNTCVWLPMPERIMGFRSVSAHEEFQTLLGESIEAFWADHVVKGLPPAPDGSSSASKAISHLYPNPESDERLELSEENLARKLELDSLKQDEKKLKGQIAKIDQELKLLMKHHEVGIFPDGSQLTYRKTSPRPSTCKNCGHETPRSSFRSMRFKKAK